MEKIKEALTLIQSEINQAVDRQRQLTMEEKIATIKNQVVGEYRWT